MAALSTNRIAWTYTSDSGIAYRVAAQKALTDQAVLGGSAAAATVPPKPGSLKMRRMTFSDGAGHSRVLPVYDPAAAPAVGTSINVNVLENSTALTASGHVISENSPRMIKQST
jgi:hypothetical protein